MESFAKKLHVVCGAPGAGKTSFAYELAAKIGAVVFDSDEVTQRLVKASLALAGMDVDDRDSPRYKAAFRDVVYETLWDLAVSNAKNIPVIIAGPFTSECADPDWPEKIVERTGLQPQMWFVRCPCEIRRERIAARNEDRDRSKLENWEHHRQQSRKEIPAFLCTVIDPWESPITAV
jgi:predicted kinase